MAYNYPLRVGGIAFGDTLLEERWTKGLSSCRKEARGETFEGEKFHEFHGSGPIRESFFRKHHMCAQQSIV